MQSASWRQLTGVAVLLAIAAVAGLLFSPESIIAELEGIADTPLLFVAVVTAVYLVRPFLLWPPMLVAIALGYLYDPMIALPAAIIGAMMTATPPYLIGRYARGDVGLFGVVSTSGDRLVRVVGETRSVIVGRLSPIPADPVSYGAGMSDISPRSFYVGTGIGETPWAVVGVFTGASMSALTLSEFALSVELLAALTGVAVLTLAGPLYSHVRASRGQAST